MTAKSLIAGLKSRFADDHPGYDSDSDCRPLDDGAGSPRPPRSAREPETAPPPKASEDSKGSGSGDRVHTSIYLPRDLRRCLREIAAAEECKVHDLILEGVREVVQKRLRG